MRFDRKPEIRCLNPIGSSNSANFVGHPLLIVKTEKMLNYRIAECNVEAGVLELSKISGIANDRFDVGEEFWLRLEIESNDLDVNSVHPSLDFPKPACASNVKDTNRFG